MGCKKSGSDALIGGLIIIAVGTLLLLSQLGLLHLNIWRLWPMVFVVVGIGKIIGGTSTGDRVWGCFVIGIGALILGHEFGYIAYGIGQLWPLFIIGAGAVMIWQAYEVRNGTGFFGPSNPDLHTFNIFGGSERQITAKNFRGGQLFAMFGGFDIDLRQADIDGDSAVIEATAIFGGGEIKVPTNWAVEVKGMGIFGAYDDKSRQLPPDPSRPSKKLVVKGVAMFGGIEIKN